MNVIRFSFILRFLELKLDLDMAAPLEACQKHRAVIEFLVAEGETPLRIHNSLKNVYKDNTIDKHFSNGVPQGLVRCATLAFHCIFIFIVLIMTTLHAKCWPIKYNDIFVITLFRKARALKKQKFCYVENLVIKLFKINF